MSTQIITDSTSDISQKQAAGLGIAVLPLHVIFQDAEYADGIDLQIDDFYEKLIHSETLPTTSQVTPDQYLPYFEAAKQNKDTVIVITVSEKLSGTYQSAVIAKDICEYENIYIVDSLTVTLGLQILVRLAIDLLQAGHPAQDIVRVLETDKHKLRLFALVETLEYLKKGGRLSSLSALAGTILNIKPIIEVIDGKVDVAGKARGITGAYSKIFKLIEQTGGIDRTKYFCVGYTSGIENLEPFLEYFKNKLDLNDRLTSPIGSVVGTHAGPGACAIAFFSQN